MEQSTNPNQITLPLGAAAPISVPEVLSSKSVLGIVSSNRTLVDAVKSREKTPLPLPDNVVSRDVRQLVNTLASLAQLGVQLRNHSDEASERDAFKSEAEKALLALKEVKCIDYVKTSSGSQTATVSGLQGLRNLVTSLHLLGLDDLFWGAKDLVGGSNDAQEGGRKKKSGASGAARPGSKKGSKSKGSKKGSKGSKKGSKGTKRGTTKK